MVGEQQHERARGVPERRHELLFDGRQQLERHGFRARIVRPELVRDRVEVVEVEKRQGWRRCTCEPGRERRARPRALDPVDDARPGHDAGEGRLDGLGRLHQVAARPEPGQAGREAVRPRVDLAQVGAGRDQAAGRLTGEARRQRADEAIERGLVDEPLVRAVLAHGLHGVQRRHVRRRRGRKLRRQLRHDALGPQACEQR